ncbi:hypothetical protein NQZ68_014740 [Dissostichus eleginoides]|nr:hypothetical protein NQZ68_014740 [Dissostichus eleginoides]
MEAAVLSRSRAGGLFFLFTLLCLVCIATSLMADNTLARWDAILEPKNTNRPSSSSLLNGLVRHQIIPFIHHRYRHITAAMAAAVSSRSRGAAGGLFFLLTLLGLVCTAASRIDEKKLENLRELIHKAEQDLDIWKAQSDTDFELLYGLIMDNVEFDKEILKFEKDLRAHKNFFQALEEYQAEFEVKMCAVREVTANRFNTYLIKYCPLVVTVECKPKKGVSGGKRNNLSCIKYQVRHQIIPFIHHRYRHITAAMAAAVSSRSRGAAGGLFFLFTLLGLVCTAASRIDEKKLENFRELIQKAEQDLDIWKAQRDTDFELLYGLIMDNVEFDKEILKFEKDLRAHKNFFQALEEYQAEL